MAAKLSHPDLMGTEIGSGEGRELTVVQTDTPNPTPQVRPSRLRTLRGVRREMARVYADARNGVLEPSVATRLTYILTCLQKVLEVESIELRLDALEQRAGDPAIRTAYDGIKRR